jgi:serine protein kinase
LDAASFISEVRSGTLREFASQKHILSFREFLELFLADPAPLARTAPQYIADAFEHFGTEMIRGIGGGETLRYKLFDAAFDQGLRPVFGQEIVQQDLCSRISSFAAAGKADRLLMLHGPNGSSKSSLADCIFRALESYSRQPEGTIYTFNWVFTEREDAPGKMGFDRAAARDDGDSLAHVDGKELGCRIPCEMKDNPLLLVPARQRAELLSSLAAGATRRLNVEPLRRADICPKCRAIFDTLRAAYGGDWQRVIRHVQVERIFISRRYREGAVSIEPMGVVDAGTEPYMPDRSSALPLILQGLQLFAPCGDLVDANRGMAEYSDLLKRPLEANKYLLTTAERGTVSLPRFEAHLDLVALATVNEQQLTAFKLHPDFNSFRGRIELVPCPYLLEYRKEARIYEEYLTRSSRERHVAPHVAECAALWAVLTRLRRPDAEQLEGDLAEAAAKLAPLEKARLYDSGQTPAGLREAGRNELAAGVEILATQFRESAIEFEGSVCAAYEGAFGASPREIQLVLAEAAAAPGRKCVTPLAVLEQIERLVQQTSVYDFLRLEADGDYWKPAEFIETVRAEYLRTAWAEASAAAGLIDQTEYQRLLNDYFLHVRAYVTGDKVRNPANGHWEPPNEEVMKSVERRLKPEGDTDEFRKHLAARAAAWSLDHPGEKVVPQVVFRDLFETIKDSYFAENRKAIQSILESLLKLATGDEGTIPHDQVARAKSALEALRSIGYCDSCMKEMVSFALRHADAVYPNQNTGEEKG